MAEWQSLVSGQSVGFGASKHYPMRAQESVLGSYRPYSSFHGNAIWFPWFWRTLSTRCRCHFTASTTLGEIVLSSAHSVVRITELRQGQTGTNLVDSGGRLVAY